MSITWYEALDSIENLKGKEKLAFLQSHNVIGLKAVLAFVYSPRVTTGISKKRLSKEVTDSMVSLIQDDSIYGLMSYLKQFNTGRDIDVFTCQNYLSKIDNPLEKKFTEAIITKDMPIGISASTINKAFPDLIPVFKLQKGILFDGEPIKKSYVSLKLDGNSATVFNDYEETYMLSRSGAIMEGFDHILQHFERFLPKGYVYQGELIAKNYDNLSHGPLFQLSNGITNSKSGDKSRLQHVVFDMIRIEEFRKGFSEASYDDRVDLIKWDIDEEYHAYEETYSDVCRIPFYLVSDDLEEIDALSNEVIRDGFEGLMLCELDSVYKVGKQKWLKKVKEFKTADVEVIGIKEHKHGNKVGSLLIDWKGHEVAVPGFSDDLKKQWWENPNSIVGQIIEMKYFRETTDTNGSISVRFPGFIRIRDDKQEVSIDE